MSKIIRNTIKYLVDNNIDYSIVSEEFSTFDYYKKRYVDNNAFYLVFPFNAIGTTYFGTVNMVGIFNYNKISRIITKEKVDGIANNNTNINFETVIRNTLIDLKNKNIYKYKVGCDGDFYVDGILEADFDDTDIAKFRMPFVNYIGGGVTTVWVNVPYSEIKFLLIDTDLYTKLSGVPNLNL